MTNSASNGDALSKADLVESQHGEITLALRHLPSLPGTSTAGEAFSVWLSRFGELLKDHFTAEESLLAELGYGDDEVGAMKQDHTRLMNLYLSVLDSMMQGRHAPLDQVADQFSREIKRHMTEHDARYLL